MPVRKRTKQTKRTKRRRRQRTRRMRQRGGKLTINSVSSEHEADTIVTLRPDSREEDSMPMTGRLTVLRELLE